MLSLLQHAFRDFSNDECPVRAQHAGRELRPEKGAIKIEPTPSRLTAAPQRVGTKPQGPRTQNTIPTTQHAVPTTQHAVPLHQKHLR
jgi:hypothetical protein